MKTRCPNCETQYDIDEAALASANYTAVCCNCHQVFNAKETIGSEEPVMPPPPDYTPDQPHAPGYGKPETKSEHGFPPAPGPRDDDWAFVQQRGTKKNHIPTAPPITDVPEDFASLAAAELPPHHFSKHRKQKSKPGPMMTAAVLALALIATGQLAWINKKQLLEHPQGRQLVQIVCDLAACELERQKAIDKFAVLHRNLQPSISHQRALSFTLSFTNEADFSQQLPILQLSLLDHKDQLLAQRNFSPDEYLDPAASNDRNIKPKEIINVELLLWNQALNASGFKLEFL